jgi:hypothetical protein
LVSRGEEPPEVSKQQQPEGSSIDLIVRRVSNREEVHRVTVSNPTERKVENVMRGMLINMGEDFFIDDTAMDGRA